MRSVGLAIVALALLGGCHRSAESRAVEVNADQIADNISAEADRISAQADNSANAMAAEMLDNAADNLNDVADNVRDVGHAEARNMH